MDKKLLEEVAGRFTWYEADLIESVSSYSSIDERVLITVIVSMLSHCLDIV
jgi:hypothetical protein